MNRFRWLPILGLAASLAISSNALGQRRPYIGFVYPAGGQRGTTFQIRLGGQQRVHPAGLARRAGVGERRRRRHPIRPPLERQQPLAGAAA